MKQAFLLLILTITLATCAFSQSDNFRFKKELASNPNQSVAFAVANKPGYLEKLLASKEVTVKHVLKDWIYIQTTPTWIAAAEKSGLIDHFYFEFAPPTALNDSTRVKHFVNEVHQGLGGLPTGYTGKDVIIGYVDQGLDWNHGDFIDSNGNTRVLYYWDHTLPNGANTPLPYGYGRLWTAADIDNGTCGSNEETSAHGTSVAGAGSANGLANGKEKGMAPDSKLIIVETNFNLPNWTLTVADACDFIFKQADLMGLPAVVNLSVGSYLGSHDGNDPAAVLMESLVDAKPGRLIVGAAGNSGAWGKYHVQGNMDADTSFVWIQPNPSSQLGANTCYMDVWSDLSDATWKYALGANLPNGTFEERAETQYRLATFGAPAVIYDTLWNGPNRIATIELYPEIVGQNFHMEVYFSKVDSTNYNFSFKTTGSGKYDGWSGSTAIGLNNLITTVPDVTILPSIAHYLQPDSLQTIVSSWNCSEKIVSVGNLRNRFGHLDNDGNMYQPAPTYNAVVGQLSPNSSKGPSRHGVVKPDVSASGDVSLSAGPLWVLTNPAYNSLIGEDGLHLRNGGTSMAAPVVSGIGALYFEKCGAANYANFLADLKTTSFDDVYTGATPNFAYGYGKIHALDLLLAQDCNLSVEENSAEILLYPVPTGDDLHIVASGDIKSVRLIDIQGKEVLSVTEKCDVIAVDSLVTGTYLVQIETENGITWSKIIKK